MWAGTRNIFVVYAYLHYNHPNLYKWRQLHALCICFSCAFYTVVVPKKLSYILNITSWAVDKYIFGSIVLPCSSDLHHSVLKYCQCESSDPCPSVAYTKLAIGFATQFYSTLPLAFMILKISNLINMFSKSPNITTEASHQNVLETVNQLPCRLPMNIT